ncbi:MAG TPA: hypothetical protein VK853_00555 [Ilumatobacteraceae bacterium]|nr:hypothetical protein [Ilumatobacteraceae bacterium]
MPATPASSPGGGAATPATVPGAGGVPNHVGADETPEENAQPLNERTVTTYRSPSVGPAMPVEVCVPNAVADAPPGDAVATKVLTGRAGRVHVTLK